MTVWPNVAEKLTDIVGMFWQAVVAGAMLQPVLDIAVVPTVAVNL
jgi:hypothetical protein